MSKLKNLINFYEKKLKKCTGYGIDLDRILLNNIIERCVERQKKENRIKDGPYGATSKHENKIIL